MPKRATSELELDEKTHEVKLLCSCGRTHVISQKEKDVILTTDESGIEDGTPPKDTSNSEKGAKGFLDGFFTK